jgi:subtilisin-like proprotein convertase family protein
MKNLFRGLLLFAALVVFTPDSFSQLDTKHYIPPMFGREDTGDHYIVLSTPNTTPFDVTITDGSGTLITTQTISNVSSSTYALGAGTATQFLVEETELNTIMANEGLILTGNFPFYVNIRVVAGPQAGSLTSKGSKAALGQDFRTGHLFNNDGDAFRKANVIGIMATEDNTTVNITDISTGVIFKDAPQTAGTSDDIQIVLNEGESYVLAAYLDEPGATNNVNGVNGTHITSDKDIVVNTGSWLGGNALVGGAPSTGRDLGIDQIVPLDLVGDEYVVIKGEGVDNEKVIVVASADNTELFLNGNAVPVATINTGDYHVFDVNDFTANENMYIESSAPVFVYQTANSGDGTTDDNERQCGLNFLPPIGCSGSKTVLLPDVDFIGTAQINIIANAGSTVVVDGATLGAGDAVTGTGSYVTYKLANAYTGDILITSDDLTRVSLVNLSGNIGAAGYFSGFTKDITVQTNTVNADNIALEGCIPASFTFSIDQPSTQDTEITYQVMGTATNGVDYQFIDTMLTIPAGQTSGSVFINSFADGITEGQETVYIIYQPDPCSPVDTAVLFIDDAQPIEFTLDGINLNCYDDSSGQIQVNATGGFPPYTFYYTDNGGNGTTNTTQDNPIPNLPADTYSVQVYDIYGCKADALIIGGVYDADTTFLPDGTGVSYDAVLPISGFDAGQTLDNMTQLQQVCATMEHSYLGDLQIKIISPSGQEVILKEFNGGGSCDLGEPFASGPVDGQNSNLTDPGIGYEYCWNATPNYGTMVQESGNFTHTIPASIGGTYTDNYLPSGAYTSFENLDGLLGSTLNGDWTLEVSDQFALDNGYIFNWNISLQSDLPDTLVTITEPNEIDISGFVTQAQCGGTDGAIDVSVIGDFPPFTFNWSSGQTTEDLSGIGAGTYTVFVTDANGCTDSATYILNNISSMNTVVNVTPVTCAGGTDGAIDVTTSGGTAPYTFSWSSGQTTEDLSGMAAGTYTLTITDDNGCIYSEDITISTLPGINISLVSTTNEVCSQGNGAIDINVTGGTGSYGYSWDNGATTQDISNIGVGTYYVTVTDGNGCTAQANYSIINDVSNCSQFCFTNIVTESLTDETCGDMTGAIDITVLDATMPYVISWNTGATTDDISGLAAGTYTVTIIDANQCELTQDFTVGNDVGTLSVSAFAVSNENCGNTDGAIDITVVGGTAPYTFLWSNGATTEDLTAVPAGTYDVTITDNNGCELTASYTVDNNTGTLSESATVINETCGNGGGGLNLTVTGGVGPYTYSWNTGATTQDIFNLSAGTYNVTITDAVGCTLNSSDYTVSNIASDLTILSTNVTNENCGDGAGEIDINVINGTPPYNYLWSNGATTEDITGLSAGVYSCTITDDLGCVITTGDINVFNQGGTLDVSVNTITNEVCGDAGGAIDIDVTGGTAPYTFFWSNGPTTEDISGLSAGNYTVTVTDNNGCTIDLIETVINESGGFAVAVTSATDENCGDGSGAIDITETGGAAPVTYSWSNGATTEDLTGINAGTYNLIATDNNGCQVNTSATIGGSGVQIIASTVSAEICGNQSGSIDITFAGGLNPYNFSWSNGAISEDISGLTAGTYDLTITDFNGCTANGSYTVGNNTNGLSITSTVVTGENCGDGAGAIDVTSTGGAAPVTYDWDNGATTEDLTGLSAGSYNLTLTDANGCAVTTSGTVVNNAAGFAASVNTVTDENCGDGTGAIDVDVTGGATPYTYSWDSGQTSEDLTGLNAGDYELTVTDNNGCSIIVNANVNNNTGTLAIANEVIGDASCASNNGFIDLSITGGSAPYTFSWSNGATTEDIAGVGAGTYTCLITDNSGCSINFTGTVDINGGAITTSDVVINESCDNANGSISVTVSGGIAPYTFSWTGGTPTTCCDYELTLFDDNANGWGGTPSPFVEVYVNAALYGSYTIPVGNGNAELTEIISVCNGDVIELVWVPGDFNALSSFELFDPSGTSLYNSGLDPAAGLNYTTTAACPAGPANQTGISGLSAGTYDLTITDNVGCQVTETYTLINEPSDLQINVTSVTDELCGFNNGEITYTVSGGTAPFTTTANGFTDGPPVGVLSNLFADDWEIITIDDNGCSDTVTVTIGNDATFITTSNVVNENCSDGNGSIDLTISGGSMNMTFDWDNGATTEDISGLSAGTYTVVITDDDNGCEDELTFTITNDVDINVSAIISDENCGDATGEIDLTVTGSTDLSFAWSNGPATEDISGLNAGSYTVTVVNNTTGCLVEETYDVNNITTGLSVSGTVTDEDCSQQDGEIDITVTGGVGPYTYLWSNGAITEDVTGLSAGSYTVTVTDQNDGCQFIATYDVQSGGIFNLDLISVTNENCSDGSGAIDIDVSGPGTFNVDYAWSNGEITQDISNLSAGQYTVDVTNQFNCTIQLTVDVLNDGDLTVLSSYTNESCGDGNGSIDLTVTGSTDISYSWSNGATTEDLSGLSAGTYDVTITNNTSGCVATESIMVSNITSGVDIQASNVTDEFCGNGSGAVDITVGGGVGPYSFSWSNGATTEDLAGLSAGTYTVTVTDDNDGCTVTQDFTVLSDGTFTVTGAATNATCATCPDGSVNITVNETFPDGPYTYSWDNGATTEDISGLLPGDYTVTVTGNSGCVVTATFTVGNDNTAGIESDENGWMIQLYPNPTRTEFTLVYDFGSDDQVMFRMTNMIGEIIDVRLLSSTNGVLAYGVQNLSSGVYFVQLSSDRAEQTIKLIVTK